MKSKPAALLILLVTLGLLLPADAVAEFTTLPNGFADQPVVHGLSRPTAIDWLPDSENDRLLVATQAGIVFRVAADGTATEILNLVGTVCSGGEMGLLGLAVDPEFSPTAKKYIYLYYTDKRGSGDCGAASRANRVSRFIMNDQGRLGGEDILIDNIPAPGGNHNGGDLQFGSDGLLYISVGDGGQDLNTGAGQNGNGNAHRLDLLNGKILRINKDGSIPATNPFRGAGTVQCSAVGAAPGALPPPQNQDQGQTQKKKNKKKKHKRGGKHQKGGKSKKKKRADRRDEKRKRRQERREGNQLLPAGTGPSGSSLICQEILATGLRNPFRLAFDQHAPASEQRLFINDVGGGAWEEIDLAAPGADYGWNVREGPCPTGVMDISSCSSSGRFVEPVFAYSHTTGCRTITGGAFVPEDEDWSAYAGVYFYADFICDAIFALGDESPGDLPEMFASGTAATQLAFGPGGALYYTTFDSIDEIAGSAGQVRRIVPPA